MDLLRASVSNIEDIVRLNESVQQIHVEHEPAYFRAFEASVVREQIRAALADPAVVFLVAVEGGAALGYAMCRRREHPETAYSKARTYLELEQIAVAPEARKRGVGSALVDESVAPARSLDIADVELSVWEFNEEAKRLFTKKGFSSCWHRMKYNTSNLKPRDA